jgi:hypothetical protein
LFLAASLATVVAMFYAIENSHGTRAWHRYLEASEARRDRNNLADFLPPPVSDDLNFAKTPLLEGGAYKGKAAPPITGRIASAAGLVEHDAMGDFQKGTWTCFECADAGSITLSTEAMEGARRVLASFKPYTAEIDELRNAAQRPSSRFEADYYSPVQSVPDFVFLRRLTQIFSCRALAELAVGDPAAAYADLEVVRKMADGLQRQPTLLAAMMRCAILGSPYTQPFYEGWARGQWTQSQYEHFQEYFAAADLLQNVDWSMRGGERLGLRDLVLNHSGKELVKLFNFTSGNNGNPTLQDRLKEAGYRLMPRGWWLRGLVVHQEILDRTLGDIYDPKKLRVNAAACDGAGVEIDQAISAASPFHFLAAVAIPNVGRAFKRAADNQIRIDQAMLVCALERYRLSHKEYPASLDNLVPEIASSIPKDPFSGRTPSYKRQPDGTFLLFSASQSDEDSDEPSPEDVVWPFRRAPGLVAEH